VPKALLAGPAFGLPGDKPSLGPLLPVVLPFMELPVVVELAAWPPGAELPPARAPAPVPSLWENAEVVESKSADARVSDANFIGYPLFISERVASGAVGGLGQILSALHGSDEPRLALAPLTSSSEAGQKKNAAAAAARTTTMALRKAVHRRITISPWRARGAIYRQRPVHGDPADNGANIILSRQICRPSKRGIASSSTARPAAAALPSRAACRDCPDGS